MSRQSTTEMGTMRLLSFSKQPHPGYPKYMSHLQRMCGLLSKKSTMSNRRLLGERNEPLLTQNSLVSRKRAVSSRRPVSLHYEAFSIHEGLVSRYSEMDTILLL